MKKLFIFPVIFLIVILTIIFLNCLQTAVPQDKEKDIATPQPAWPKRLGGTGADGCYSIKVDSEGSVVTSGFVTGDVDLNGDHDTSDPGGESGTNYGLSDSFITKFNSSGTWQWFKRLGNSSSDSAHCIATDRSDDVIATGTVINNADLDSDGVADGGAELGGAPFGSSDIYFKKFRKLSVPLMGIRLGGLDEDMGRSIIADASSDIIAVGIISDVDADLNWDRTISAGAETGSGTGNYHDIFITKFNSNLQTMPWWQWSMRLGGTNEDCGLAVAADADKNIIVAGFVTGVADFNGNGGTDDITEESGSYGGKDVIICKFDKSGALIWGERLGGTGDDEGRGVAVDSGGNIYITGVVNGDADLNGDGDASDTGIGESAAGYGIYDGFIAKFDSSGAFQWSKRIGGASWDYGQAITADISGNVIITGYANGNADLNGDQDISDDGESAAGYAGYDIFIAKFNSSGTSLWTKRVGGSNADYGYGIAADSAGNVYAGGIVNGSADLNGNGNAADNAAESGSLGADDIFIAKFNADGVPLN